LRRTRGRIIAFEGIDQSGKKTQASLLAKRLVRNNYRVCVWDFPDYRTPLGKQLRAYLAGTIQLDYHAVHLLYAANKWERAQELNRLISRGDIVIVNRYSPSNLAYGVAHGLQLAWLESLENGLPKSDVVFVLRITPGTSFNRKREQRDLHEGDYQYLQRVGNAYLRLARMYGWKIINGENDSRTVQSEVWKLTTHLMGIKSAQG
jgi:dTMP kinase